VSAVIFSLSTPKLSATMSLTRSITEAATLKILLLTNQRVLMNGLLKWQNRMPARIVRIRPTGAIIAFQAATIASPVDP
jgi:hypothetical protein